MSVVYYAIGDVHGEFEKLKHLHKLIIKTHHLDFPNKDLRIVHLGDYIDRGPKSFDVVDYLMNLNDQPFSEIITLKGNHEQMMLNAFEAENMRDYHFWVDSGGQQTLLSYRTNGFDEPPIQHLDWLRRLPTYHWDQKEKLIFVHAGIDPIFFPNDGEDRHLWTRSPRFLNPGNWDNNLPTGTIVIHGHTPTQSGQPDISGNVQRINVDTGACYGGDLTAAVLASGAPPRFLTA